MTESDEERALGGVHGKMLKVCNFVSNHEEAWVFYGHVTEEMAPGYSKIIRRPMCLKAIEDKIKDSFLISDWLTNTKSWKQNPKCRTIN